jgi:FdhD protein
VSDRPGSRSRVLVDVVEDGRRSRKPDELATEEPLEIRLRVGGEVTTAAVTMRTPGNDFELAVGFLAGEGVVAGPRDVRRVSYCTDRDVDGAQRYNIVNVDLTGPPRAPVDQLERHFTMTSACGVCGKASLDALEQRCLLPVAAAMREAQGGFSATGGLHAAALFDADGGLIAVREDVGRHNALDKLVGWALLDGRLPLAGHVLLVSGRSSFELAQKAVAAGAPILCSVSAPSSLAVDLATRFGLTLVGFLRDRRFNVYTGSGRVRTGAGG